MSPQQKPDALQTSAPWQLKCFESRQKSAQGQIPHANGSTHNCIAKSTGISAGPCIYRMALQHIHTPLQLAVWILSVRAKWLLYKDKMTLHCKLPLAFK